MTINYTAEGGAAQIKELTVISNKFRTIDVSNAFREIYIYQSCLDNSVRATIKLGDTGYRAGSNSVASIERGDLDLTVGEKWNILISDGYGNNLYFRDEYHLRTEKTRDIYESTNQNVCTIDLCSLETINNELVDNRVAHRFDGKISDSVVKILKDSLKTKKSIFIDNTYNSFNFLGNNEKPFYKIPWLAARSVPDLPNAPGKLAGYFFYEVPNDGRGNGGFNFRSIDKLFTQRPKHKLIFTNSPYLPVGYDRKILSYSIDKMFNINNISSGALAGSRYKIFNPLTKKYEENSFNDSKRMNDLYMGGYSLPNVAADLKLVSKDVKIYTDWLPIGILPSGSTFEKQLDNVETLDWNKQEIVRQATARYNNLFNTRINIVIPGDFSIKAGDLLTCDFPEISGKVTKEISNKKSGNYLVIDVAHLIKATKSFTSINLVRESIYNS